MAAPQDDILRNAMDHSSHTHKLEKDEFARDYICTCAMYIEQSKTGFKYSCRSGEHAFFLKVSALIIREIRICTGTLKKVRILNRKNIEKGQKI